MVSIGSDDRLLRAFLGWHAVQSSAGRTKYGS